MLVSPPSLDSGWFLAHKRKKEKRREGGREDGENMVNKSLGRNLKRRRKGRGQLFISGSACSLVELKELSEKGGSYLHGAGMRLCISLIGPSFIPFPLKLQVAQLTQHRVLGS